MRSPVILRTLIITLTIALASTSVLLTIPKKAITPSTPQHNQTYKEKRTVSTTTDTPPFSKTAPTTSTQQTATPTNKLPQTQSPVQKTPTSPIQTTIPPAPKIPTAHPTTTTPAKQTNKLVRSAVVNILCSATNQTLKSLSGSGVIIDPSGIILTNAHIAQYFLLTDYPTTNAISCSIRTGSPAYPRFKAELLYLSPSWITKNAALITQQNPTGTGEFDFALLRITGAIDNTPLPLFPFLTPHTETAVGETIFIAGYPASFLGSIGVERDLYLLSAQSTISEIFTFGEQNTIDLISVGGTVLSQRGASGGAVANQNGNLIGIVVTTTEGTSTNERDLRAITIKHVDQTLTAETGTGLKKLLSFDLIGTAKNFNESIAPLLRSILIKEIEHH